MEMIFQVMSDGYLHLYEVDSKEKTKLCINGVRYFEWMARE